MDSNGEKLTYKQPLTFLMVGAANTLLDFGFYTFLTLTILTSSNQIAIAGLVSGTFALACAFTTHSLITWRGSYIDRKTILKFMGFTGFGMWVMRPLLLSLFIQLDGLYVWIHQFSQLFSLPFTYSFIANTGAFGLMAVIVLIYNYITYDRFVFKKATTRTGQKNHSES